MSFNPISTAAYRQDHSPRKAASDQIRAKANAALETWLRMRAGKLPISRPQIGVSAYPLQGT
jgi:hypothetical protein